MSSRKLYASVPGVSNIVSAKVSTSHSASVSTAIIQAESTTLGLGDETTIDLGYTDDHAQLMTGYVKGIDRKTPDGLITLNIHDPLIRAVDLFIAPTNPDQPFKRANISAEDLVRDVLALAGLSNYTYTPTSFTFATEGELEVTLVSSYDYCKSVADLIAWHLYADQDGQIHFVNRKPYVMDGNSGQPGDVADTPILTITTPDTLELVLKKDERDLRNRVVVYGSSGVFAEAKSNTSFDPETGTMVQATPANFYKTSLASSYIINSQAMAQKAADYNLDLFNRVGVSASATFLGNPHLVARKVITLQNSILNIDAPYYVYLADHTWGRGGYTTTAELRR